MIGARAELTAGARMAARAPQGGGAAASQRAGVLLMIEAAAGALAAGAVTGEAELDERDEADERDDPDERDPGGGAAGAQNVASTITRSDLKPVTSGARLTWVTTS